jgi:hypothetical protein
MNEPALVPDDPDPKEKKSGVKARNRSSSDQAKTETAENDLTALIHYRQAETKVLHDPACVAQLQKAAVAHTDYERRKEMVTYYKMYFDKILALDPTVKDLVDLRKTVAVQRSTQRRVAPTVPRKDPGAPLSGPYTLSADQF